VSAVTPGITRTSTSCARPAGTVDVVGVVDHDEPEPVLDGHRDLLVGLGVAVAHHQRGVHAGLERRGDLAGAGDVEPEALSAITRCTAVHGNAFEANTTRARGRRAAAADGEHPVGLQRAPWREQRQHVPAHGRRQRSSSATSSSTSWTVPGGSIPGA
jgi:hypothetical protein